MKKKTTKTCQQQNKKSEYFIFNQIIIAKAWGRKKELSDPKSGAVGCVIHRTLKMKTQVYIPLVTKSQERFDYNLSNIKADLWLHMDCTLY